jgi:hypothetical protein
MIEFFLMWVINYLKTSPLVLLHGRVPRSGTRNGTRAAARAG